MIAPRGCVYTPAALADRLASIALDGLPLSGDLKVCDPACGDGALLDAVRARRVDALLFGVDLDVSALASARARLGAVARLDSGDALARDWGDAAFDANCRGLADDLAHHAARLHDARGAEGFMGDGDVTPRHKEVADVA